MSDRASTVQYPQAPDTALVWSANPGPQSVAIASTADEMLYGGAKGGGKTDLLVARPLYQVHRSQYAGALVRENYPELLRPMDRARAIYSKLPASERPFWTGHNHRWTFPSGAFVQFGHMKDVAWTQGGNWSEILYDEVGNQADEQKVDQLISEIRCPDPEIIRQFVGSANPGFAGHPWIKRRFILPCGKNGEKIAWARVPLPDGSSEWRSRQFVPAKITDNPTYANDRTYLAALANLPERMRRCLLDGDWDAATGLAFDELDRQQHLVAPFKIPAHWPYIAGFDWGFVHNAVLVWGRVSDDGRVYVVDTIKRRLMRDWDLAGAFEEFLPVGARTNIQSGADVRNEIRAREEQSSTQETFAKRGLHLVPVTPFRIHRYRNLLTYLSWKGSDYGPQRQPMVQFFDTPTNRWLYEQLEGLVNDPDDPRDVLKVNASTETGEGGDDGYDALGTMLVSRPIVARSGYDAVEISAFDPMMLRAAAARASKGQGILTRKKDRKFY